MKQHILPAVRLTLILALLTGLVYPLVVTAAAAECAPAFA